METETLLKTSEDIVKEWTKEQQRPETNRLDVYIEKVDLVPAVQALVQAHWGYLSAISGLDISTPAGTEDAVVPPDGHLEVLYHFCNRSAILTLRIRVPYTDAHVPSICKVIPSATLYERELMELFGVIVDETPVPDRLVLSDDWPVGVFPLRKSFTGLDSPNTEAQEN